VNLADFQKKVAGLTGRNSLLGQAVAQAAQMTQDKARELAPKRTGKLASTILADIQDDLAFRLTAGTKYAAIQEYGGEVHGRPYLRFRGRSGGWVTVKKVKIPARPYLRPAMAQAPDFLRDRLEELMKGLTK